MNTIDKISKESEDLETHVELCAIRYQELDHRIDKIDNKLDEVSKGLVSLQNTFKSDLIKAVSAIIVAVLTAIGVVVGVALPLLK